MNAIEDNAYTKMLTQLGQDLPRPRAILVVSAHWLTRGTFVTNMARPQTIHDFGGFPKALFDVQYPAPGSPATAQAIKDAVTESSVGFDDHEWGLDHGTWAVLKHMYPGADVPVLQLSISAFESPEKHLRIGNQLRDLRSQGVLIVGSGNLVHNLRAIDWNVKAKPHDWALEFDADMKRRLESREIDAIVREALTSTAGRMSHPTPDHFMPLYYVLGASDSKDELKTEYEEMQNASISMRSFSFGRTS